MKHTDRTKRRRLFRRLTLQSLDDRRVFATLSGVVFNDENDSMQREVAEVGLANRIVFLDSNDNEAFDSNERYFLTESDGRFDFEDVLDGSHVLRVFNGTQSQIQTTPTLANFASPIILAEDIVDAVPRVTITASSGPVTYPAVMARGTSLQTIAATGQASTLDLNADIVSLSRLADGNLLVLAQNNGTGRIFQVDASLSAASELSGGDSAAWEASALDDNGRGVLRAGSSVWSIDATANSLQATTAIAERILGDSSTRLADGPTRSILANPASIDNGSGGTTDGLSIDVWSNFTSSPINTQPFMVPGVSELVALSDEAGLLVLRNDSGIGVYSIDDNLSLLYTVQDVAGPVAIDAVRGLLLTLSSEDAGIRLFNSETGAQIAELAIDLATLGGVTSLLPDADLQAIVAVGAAGVAEISLRQPAARRVTISGGMNVDGADFGLRLIGSNTAPQYGAVPSFDTLEDISLNQPARTVLGDASDGDDTFVLLQRGEASLGVATIGIDGSLNYVPFPDANGSDSVLVWLHDGRDFAAHSIPINITPVDDLPTGIQPLPDPVPENILPGVAIAPILVFDPDLPGGFGAGAHGIEVSDIRFQVINGQLVLVGTPLNYESEPEIYLTLSVNDSGSEEASSYELYIQVGDEDDPITAIVPTEANVQENHAGATIATLTIFDEDDDKSYTMSVDDNRFVIEDSVLRLKDGVSLDREASPMVTVNVTAESRDLSHTQSIVITVGDVVEIPSSIALSNESVLELRVADVVGEILVDGNPGANGHSLSVNDSRFVIVGSTLRLADGVFVTQADQQIIDLSITATLLSDGSESITSMFSILVEKNARPFHNSELPHDVNGEDGVTALDALIVINYLNEFGPGPVGHGDPGFGYDVNGDGEVTALDALLVINEINRLQSSTVGSGGEGEGEPIDAPKQIANEGHQDALIAPDDERSKEIQSQRSIQHDWVLSNVESIVEKLVAEDVEIDSIVRRFV